MPQKSVRALTRNAFSAALPLQGSETDAMHNLMKNDLNAKYNVIQFENTKISPYDL